MEFQDSIDGDLQRAEFSFDIDVANGDIAPDDRAIPHMESNELITDADLRRLRRGIGDGLIFVRGFLIFGFVSLFVVVCGSVLGMNCCLLRSLLGLRNLFDYLLADDYFFILTGPNRRR